MKFNLVPLLLVVLAGSMPCFGDDRETNNDVADVQLQVGRHYRIVLRETNGDEVVATTYWATVTKLDEETITVADGEWTQSTGPAVKPRWQAALLRWSSSIDRMMRNKPLVGRGIPMSDEVAVLPRNQITKVTPIGAKEFLELKETRGRLHPIPPHAVVIE